MAAVLAVSTIPVSVTIMSFPPTCGFCGLVRTKRIAAMRKKIPKKRINLRSEVRVNAGSIVGKPFWKGSVFSVL
jgi:hypothetical protein